MRHSRRNGPGRTRIKLAAMLNSRYGTSIEPEDIWDNNYPAAKWLDLARWGVDAKLPESGLRVNIHSWDRMGDVCRYGLAEVYRDNCGIEVCSNR